MSTIVNETFASDAGGFSAGSRVASEGADFATGYLSVPASTAATKSFAAISSGVFRTDVYTKITDTDTAGDATANSLLYLLPTAGTVASSNSITSLAFQRQTGFGGTANSVWLTVRNNSGFVETVSVFARQTWIKLSVVADFTAKTFDVLVNDVMVSKSVAWANASAADFSRVVCYNQSAGPQLYDNLLIQDSYSYPVESTLIDHDFVGGSGEIEASTPTTDNRSSEPQLWKIADDTSTYGAFTLGANGATPDASKPCLALQRCAVDGVLEVEWKTSVAGTVYFGMLFRAWDYLTPSNGGAGILRIYGGASNTYSLFLPNRAGTLITAATGAFTPSANTTYTLAIEMRGRVLIGKIKAAAIGDGSYTTLFTHTVVSSATGGRGMLAEELCGPFADNTIGATDNYVRRVKFTGRTRADEAVKTIGPCTYQLSHGSIGEIYLDSASSPDKNLFWSRGIQVGHRSTADTNGDVRSNTLINTTNCYSVRQKGTNSTEYEVLGGSDCYYTLLRRGPWVSDNVNVAVNSENFAPDLDLRGELWDKSWYSCTDSGAATSRSDASFHNWTAVNSSIAIPAGNQSLSDYSTGDELLLSQVVIPVTNGTGSVWDITHKYEGNLDPISRAISRGSGTLTAGGTDYRVARGFLAEPASALSATRLTDWRDDLAAPTGWTIGTGTLKTDAAGDTNTDGFNERHGWLEITSSGDAIDITNGSTKRLKPCFRVYGLSDTALEVAIDASTLVLNTDYWVDDLGDGSCLLQLNGDVLAGEQITVEVAGGFTLACASASFVLSGQSTTLKASRKLVAEDGSLAATGQDVELKAARKLVLANGSLSLSGQATALSAARKLSVEDGSFSLSGQSATLTYTPDTGPDYTLECANGSFSLTGQAASLVASRKLTAADGSFSLSGQDATLTYTPIGGPDYTLTCASGSFAITGQGVSLKAARKLVLANGAFVLSGQAARIAAARKLALANGSVSLSGQSADLLLARVLQASNADFTLSGQSVSLTYSGASSASSAAYYYYIFLGV